MTRLRVVRRGAPSTRRTLRALVAVAACAIAASAAIGWLYLLRDARALHTGPAVGGALPLQRLAGQDGQPALPFLLAWAPAGLAAGAALGWATRLPAVARAGVAGAVAFAVLFATGALADAVTASQSPWAHVTPQLGRGALWLGAATTAAGAALTTARTRRGRRVDSSTSHPLAVESPRTERDTAMEATCSSPAAPPGRASGSSRCRS